jgi:hypothetical protein
MMSVCLVWLPQFEDNLGGVPPLHSLELDAPTIDSGHEFGKKFLDVSISTSTSPSTTNQLKNVQRSSDENSRAGKGDSKKRADRAQPTDSAKSLPLV